MGNTASGQGHPKRTKTSDSDEYHSFSSSVDGSSQTEALISDSLMSARGIIVSVSVQDQSGSFCTADNTFSSDTEHTFSSDADHTFSSEDAIAEPAFQPDLDITESLKHGIALANNISKKSLGEMTPDVRKSLKEIYIRLSEILTENPLESGKHEQECLEEKTALDNISQIPHVETSSKYVQTVPHVETSTKYVQTVPYEETSTKYVQTLPHAETSTKYIQTECEPKFEATETNDLKEAELSQDKKPAPTAVNPEIVAAEDPKVVHSERELGVKQEFASSENARSTYSVSEMGVNQVFVASSSGMIYSRNRSGSLLLASNSNENLKKIVQHETSGVAHSPKTNHLRRDRASRSLCAANFSAPAAVNFRQCKEDNEKPLENKCKVSDGHNVTISDAKPAVHNYKRDVPHTSETEVVKIPDLKKEFWGRFFRFEPIENLTAPVDEILLPPPQLSSSSNSVAGSTEAGSCSDGQRSPKQTTAILQKGSKKKTGDSECSQDTCTVDEDALWKKVEELESGVYKHILHINDTWYVCTLCSKKLSNHLVVISHVGGKAHQKALQQKKLSSNRNVTHKKSDMENKDQGKDVTVKDTKVPANSDEEMRVKIKKMWAQVMEAEGGRTNNIRHTVATMYHCNLCQTDINGMTNVITHVRGKLHQHELSKSQKMSVPQTAATHAWESVAPADRFNQRYIRLMKDGSLLCLICDKIVVNQPSNLMEHIHGKHHIGNLHREMWRM